MCNDKTATCLQLIVSELQNHELSKENTLRKLCDVHTDIFYEQMDNILTPKIICCANKEKHLICCMELCIQCKEENHDHCTLEECGCGFNKIENREKYLSKEIQNSIKENHLKKIIIQREQKTDLVELQHNQMMEKLHKQQQENKNKYR